MSTRTLLASATLILATLFTPRSSQASQTPDLRYQDGVDVMELQREGFERIMEKLWGMTRLAELAMMPSTTSAERIQLNVTFQTILSKIGQIAVSNTHGWYPLNAQVWIFIQAGPGSSQSVVVEGMDVAPHALAIDTLNVYTSAQAHSAKYSLVIAREWVTFGLQRNCVDLSSLGVDANCGSTVPFCRGGVNSTGLDGRLYGTGSLVAGGADQLQLSVYGCPSGSLGWFIMGRNTTQLPFGNGELCIQPSGSGLMRISPATMVPSFSTLDLSLVDVDPQITSLIQPGSTWYFQFLFGDSGNSTVNTTNALQVTFEP